MIAARGSGDTLNTIGVLGSKIGGQLARRAEGIGVDYDADGVPYTAVGIDWKKIVFPLYVRSKNEGRDNLRELVKQQAKDCPKQRLVLVGFSQGAHVVGDVLSRKVGGLTPGELSKIAAVALIADPRFNAKEPFATGEDLRQGHNGILGARSPGDLASVKGRVRAWCLRNDIVCQGLPTFENVHDQQRYFNVYGGEIVEFIARRLGWIPGLASAGTGHTCAVTGEGAVRCWGRNDRGQLGDGTTKSRTSPVAVRGLDNVLAVSAGYKHTCALMSDGTVSCWGANYTGQLGDGTMQNRSRPVTVRSLRNVTSVTAADEHSCALTRTGDAWCWGEPDHGQLGTGAGLDPELTPIFVRGFPGRVAAISAGGFHTCGLTHGGGAYCWGQNFSGEAGHGRRGGWPQPLQVVGLGSGVSEISAGASNTCAVHRGAVKCWGSWYRTNYRTPVGVAELERAVASISTGGGHCAIVKGRGALCSNVFKFDAAPPRPQAVAPSGLKDAVSATSGAGHTCAHLVSGKIVCWGSNREGQLGDGTTNDRTKPAEVEGL